MRPSISPRLLSLLTLLIPACAGNSGDTLVTESRVGTSTIRYTLDGTTFESTIIHPLGASPSSLPGILMVPNWLGPTDASAEKAKDVLRQGGGSHVLMMVDMYGTEVRPTNGAEAGAAAGLVRSDRGMMRARAAKALEVFRAEGSKVGLDPDRIAAIGFCFGGGTVLELGRAGADLHLIASFHGDLLSPTLAEDAGKTKAKVLVLHGADDPYVPQDHVQQWVSTMRGTDVDWQLIQFADTVHSFTDPAADSDGARFQPRSNRRAMAMLQHQLAETWGN